MSQTRTGTRTLVSSIGAVVASVALLFGATTSAVAARPSPPVVEKYVALGDSYAAGQGAGTPLDTCLRSTAAYPVLLDAEPKTNLLRTAACSGATIADVADHQLSQVNRGTTLVTLTVGANDLGAGAAYAACAVPPVVQAACDAATTEVFATLQSGAIAIGIEDLVMAIAERAPNARIVVTDYPMPFVRGLTGPGGITEDVNAVTAAMSDQIATGVLEASFAGANVELVQVGPAFVGRQVGDTSPYLGADPANALTFLHPTAEGQDAYRSAVLAVLAD